MSYEKKVKIHLHGRLKKLYDKPLELSGNSVAEIINGMCQVTGRAFHPKLGEKRLILKVEGFESKEALFAPIPADLEELHIMPEMCGGKGGGFFKILLGAVLIAASFYLPGSQALFGTGLTFNLSAAAFNFGLSLVLGGLLEVLSPQPKIDRTGDTKSDPEASKYLGASQNTVKIGTRIPLIYGTYKVYGHYLSFDVDAKDVATN